MTKSNKILHRILIGVFILLYVCVAFVSTLHAITFFQLANTLSLAILLGSAYEIGQAAVLFGILTTENKNRMLAWGMMFLLTALQVTANVYASFKFMDLSGSNDWTYWQRAILFGVQAESAEMYKVIISWISGALLPLVALGMTALVAENIRMTKGEVSNEQNEEKKETEIEINNEVEIEEAEKIDEEKIKEIEEEFKERNKKIDNEVNIDLETKEVKAEHPQIKVDLVKEEPKIEDVNTDILEENKEILEPFNKIQGWHLKNEFVDNDHNVFKRGKFIINDPSKTPTSKKV